MTGNSRDRFAVSDTRRGSGPGWRQDWLLDLAKVVGSAADCSRRQVGAVIYDPVSFHLLAVGYNGLAPGVPGCMTEQGCPRGRLSYDDVAASAPYLAGGPGSCPGVHGEDNALRRAKERGIDVAGAHIAITDEPCPGCHALLRHYGIAAAFWPGGEIALTP